MSVHECSGYYRSMSTQEDGYYMNKGSLRYKRINNGSPTWKKWIPDRWEAALPLKFNA